MKTFIQIKYLKKNEIKQITDKSAVTCNVEANSSCSPLWLVVGRQNYLHFPTLSVLTVKVQ